MSWMKQMVNELINETDALVSKAHAALPLNDMPTLKLNDVSENEESSPVKKVVANVKGSGKVFFSPYGDLKNTKGRNKACLKREVANHILKNHKDDIVEKLISLNIPISDKIVKKVADIIAGKNSASGAKLMPSLEELDDKGFFPKDISFEMLGKPPKKDEVKNDVEVAEEIISKADEKEAEKDIEVEIKEAKKKGEKLTKTGKLTKAIFAGLDGNVRSDWKKRLKSFFTEMNITSYDSIPAEFLTNFNTLIKDYKTDNKEFMEKLETSLSSAKLDIGRVNHPAPTQKELKEDVEMLEERKERQETKKEKKQPKTKEISHDDTVIAIDKPIKAKRTKKVKNIDFLLE